MSVSNTAPGERRRYFRIHDDVALSYRLLEGDSLDRAVADFGRADDTQGGLASTLLESHAAMHRDLEAIRRDSPNVANYLEQLNRKLDIIAHLLNARGAELPAHPTHAVNLSASGMSFDAQNHVEPGSVIELKLLVFPSHLCILALGAVVSSSPVETPTDGFAFRLGVDFSYIREIDRELLIRHVVQKDSAARRQRR